MTERCEHSAPNYSGRCEKCGVRLEAPSRQLRDYAERIGGEIVSMTKTFLTPSNPDQP